jgi:hypothetical protein
MPDIEPVMRDLEEHLAPTPQAKAEVRAFYRGVDHARKQIAVIIVVLGILSILVARLVINS